MQFDRDEFALLSRGGRVSRSSRAGPGYSEPEYVDYGCTPVERDPGELSRLLATARRRARARRLRATVRATWPVFGEGQDR